MRKANERGETPVEFVIIIPIAIALVFAILQAVYFYNASNLAGAAAAAAYNNARADNGTGGSGQAAGQQVISKTTNVLAGASVDVDRGPAQVSVTVTGYAPTILPFWSGPQVSQTVSGPTERWVSR